MMSFGPYRRARPRENIVPMINVVFLLLIFFLMTAQIAPPDPIPVVPPTATAEPGASLAPGTLYIAADGTLAFDTARGETVFAALSTWQGDAPLALRADAAVPAAELARVLRRLAEAGIDAAALITVAP